MVSPVLLALKIFSTPPTLETTPAPAHLHMLGASWMFKLIQQRNGQQKTLLNCFNRVFDLVARAGFEPTTFGL